MNALDPGVRLSGLVAALPAPHGFGDWTALRPRPDAIRLMGGIPAPAALPVEPLRAALDDLWSTGAGVAALQYSAATGLDGLRGWIAAREGVDPARVLVTNGGMHGLALSVLAFVAPGGTVAVDDPVFPLFLRVLDLVGARTLPVPVEPDGLDVDHLAARLAAGERIDAVYTVPDFHNPSQGTLSAAKRVALVALAERYGFVLIADDPYRELRFAGTDQGAAVLHDCDRVVHVNTFTKTLGPGLRLGWLVLPPDTVEPVARLRSRLDSNTSTFVQSIVQHLLTTTGDWFDESLVAARETYRRRARVLVDALRAQLPGVLEVRDPEGGFFCWPRLVDPAVDPAALYARASALGVEYQRGEFFGVAADSAATRHLRLAYSDRDEDELRTGVARLAAAYHDLTR